MAKLYSTEAVVSATRVATQIFGGAGFIVGTPVARFYRDAKILEIGEGTSEIQRLVIARGLGLPLNWRRTSERRDAFTDGLNPWATSLVTGPCG